MSVVKYLATRKEGVESAGYAARLKSVSKLLYTYNILESNKVNISGIEAPGNPCGPRK